MDTTHAATHAAATTPRTTRFICPPEFHLKADTYVPPEVRLKPDTTYCVLHRRFYARETVGTHGFSVHPGPWRATSTSIKYGFPSAVWRRARPSAALSSTGVRAFSPSTPKPLAIDAMSMSGLPR